jgi:hypothetical protein
MENPTIDSRPPLKIRLLFFSPVFLSLLELLLNACGVQSNGLTRTFFVLMTIVSLGVSVCCAIWIARHFGKGSRQRFFLALLWSVTLLIVNLIISVVGCGASL